MPLYGRLETTHRYHGKQVHIEVQAMESCTALEQGCSWSTITLGCGTLIESNQSVDAWVINSHSTHEEVSSSPNNIMAAMQMDIVWGTH